MFIYCKPVLLFTMHATVELVAIFLIHKLIMDVSYTQTMADKFVWSITSVRLAYKHPIVATRVTTVLVVDAIIPYCPAI